jgi:CMP-N-acetylneuraminic acid synthetase
MTVALDRPGGAVLAVIPARGGSKGLARKNIRLLGGKPLIAHSIEAARAAASIDAVLVSTEDPEIAEIARAWQAEVAVRPPELADDVTQNHTVLRHLLTAGSLAARYRYVVLLQPTSPLRTAADIDACLAPLLAGKARSVMTLTPVEHHPGKTMILRDGCAEPFTCDADVEARRQDLTPIFRQNGAVYGVAITDFLHEDRFFLRPCAVSIMPPERSIDIDGEADLILAEALHAKASAVPACPSAPMPSNRGRCRAATRRPAADVCQ